MRIAVIGGTKFIGPHVVRQLVSQGHEVTVFHRGQTEAPLPPIVRHLHDARSTMPIVAYPKELFEPAPDVVIHTMLMGERDTKAAVDACRGRVRRLVALSSGDVYLAYGRFTGIEPGPVEPGPLYESSSLRTVLYPYRKQASLDDWIASYEKLLVERGVLGEPSLEGVVLRLPKVYGPGANADFATVHQYRHHPQWRWTHGYVENVAAAIVLAALHPDAAAGRVYNVGEAYTPTVAERLQDLPPSSMPLASSTEANFDQHIVYDTSRVRGELGYGELISYEEGLRRTLQEVAR